MAQFLIFGAFNLLAYGLLFAICAVPLALLGRVGMRMGAYGRWLRWVLPAAAVCVVVAWALASYRAFADACRTAPPVEIFAARHRATGMVVAGYDRGLPGGRFNSAALLESGLVSFVDHSGRRECLSFDEQTQPPRASVTAHCPQFEGAKPGVVLDFQEPARIDRWWWPPVYRDVIDLRDAATGSLLARATDVVFGGGLVGYYLRAYHGDQDFSHLSCGYASADIGPMRPTLLGRPRMNQYRSADLHFITDALHGTRARIVSDPPAR